MATEKQIAASRANAMNSTGLRKGAGDAITLDPHVQADVEAPARPIASKPASDDQLQAAMAFAEAQRSAPMGNLLALRKALAACCSNSESLFHLSPQQTGFPC